MLNWPGKSRDQEMPVLDLAYLERLSGHIGAEVAAELLADGMLELADRLDRVSDLANKGDMEALLRMTHDIAGSAGHLGLSALSRDAVTANRSLREARAQAAPRLVRQMLANRQSSLDALGAFCRRNGKGDQACDQG